VKSLGWLGLGLWTPGGATAQDLDTLHQAGVTTLKVDGGDNTCTVTTLARTHAPQMTIEHGHCDRYITTSHQDPVK